MPDAVKDMRRAVGQFAQGFDEALNMFDVDEELIERLDTIDDAMTKLLKVDDAMDELKP